MNRTQAFIELLELGVSAEAATDLLDALESEYAPVRKQRREADPSPHQPVWALLNRPFGIARGFKMLFASESHETFDLNAWEDALA